MKKALIGLCALTATYFSQVVVGQEVDETKSNVEFNFRANPASKIAKRLMENTEFSDLTIQVNEGEGLKSSEKVQGVEKSLRYDGDFYHFALIKDEATCKLIVRTPDGTEIRSTFDEKYAITEQQLFKSSYAGEQFEVVDSPKFDTVHFLASLPLLQQSSSRSYQTALLLFAKGKKVTDGDTISHSLGDSDFRLVYLDTDMKGNFGYEDVLQLHSGDKTLEYSVESDLPSYSGKFSTGVEQIAEELTLQTQFLYFHREYVFPIFLNAKATLNK